jgi:cobaltochelatase CobN
VERGKPEVPVEWMNSEWKRRGLRKSVQLTISRCLGPCELSNVVAVSSAAGLVWLGNLRGLHCYVELVEWASRCQSAGRRLPLPEQLTEFRFDPFASAEA